VTRKHITLNDLHFDGHTQVGAPFSTRDSRFSNSKNSTSSGATGGTRARREGREALGIPRSSLYQKIKKHQISMSKV
jgi:transcriptional regulator of acetoin/glycerol metabolism